MRRPEVAAGISRTLLDLVNRLQRVDLPIGPPEILDATRLLDKLATIDQFPSEPSELRGWLRPIFCKRVEERPRFDSVFDEWARPRRPRPLRRSQSKNPRLGIATAARFLRSQALIVGLSISVVVVGGVALYTPFAANTSPGPTTVVVEPEPAGQASSRVVPSFLTVSLALLRENPVWVGAMVLALLPLLAVALPARMLSRGTWRRGRNVVVDMTTVEEQAAKLVPPMRTDTVERLSRHVAMSATEALPLERRPRIHASRTVEATVRNLGVPVARYQDARVRPAYLVLIEGDVREDPRARLFYEWAKRLQTSGWKVEIGVFHSAQMAGATSTNSAPRLTQTEALDGAKAIQAGRGLDHLPDPPAAQRLVIVSDGTSFADNDGRSREWVSRARFRRWRHRALFTPTPVRDWGQREIAIERPDGIFDPGFLVLPLDDSALHAWSDFLLKGRLPPFTISEPERYPRSLVDQDERARDSAEPLPEMQSLMAQLKLYLGNRGFLWLAALAVPPFITWELMLLIGRAIVYPERLELSEGGRRAGDAVFSANSLRLARLPWLRKVHGDSDHAGMYLPDWLRLSLFKELPVAAHGTVREAVREALSPAVPTSYGCGLDIGLEAPPAKGRASLGAGSRRGDALYLGYMTGHTARQLALRSPAGWSKWIEKLPDARAGTTVKASLEALTETLELVFARLAFVRGLPVFGRSRLPYLVSAICITLWILALASVVMRRRAAHDTSHAPPASASGVWLDSRPDSEPHPGDTSHAPSAGASEVRLGSRPETGLQPGDTNLPVDERRGAVIGTAPRGIGSIAGTSASLANGNSNSGRESSPRRPGERTDLESEATKQGISASDERPDAAPPDPSHEEPAPTTAPSQLAPVPKAKAPFASIPTLAAIRARMKSEQAVPSGQTCGMVRSADAEGIPYSPDCEAASTDRRQCAKILEIDASVDGDQQILAGCPGSVTVSGGGSKQWSLSKCQITEDRRHASWRAVAWGPAKTFKVCWETGTVVR